MDEDMQQLVESIKRNGVMTPATVRLKEDGRYELVSGHRRKKAIFIWFLAIPMLREKEKRNGFQQDCLSSVIKRKPKRC